MNKLEKILELSKEKGFKSLEHECDYILQKNLTCELCSFWRVMVCHCVNFDKCAEQLLEPYTSQRKLTKRERAFCEYVQTGYIARDKSGELHWSFNMPYKKCDGWVVYNNDFNKMIENLFSFIKWEDEEPYSVEELLKWDYEKE